MNVRGVFQRAALGLSLSLGPILRAQTGGLAQVRHAPSLNGRVEGSVQVMIGEDITLNGNAKLTGDLLVPGLPLISLGGHATCAGTIDGAGSALPANYLISLTGNASLGRVIRRTDPLAWAIVEQPPLPAGTRSVSIVDSGQDPGDFRTLRDLVLAGNLGAVPVPPGTYGDFVAHGGSGFVLGNPADSRPARYCFQHLTIDGNAWLDVVGPVELTLAKDLTLSGHLGAPGNPNWLQLSVAAGGVTLNGGAGLFARVCAPGGSVNINGNSQLVGGLICDRMVINGAGLLQLKHLNLPPAVAVTSPADGAVVYAPAAFTVTAEASDSDGSVTRVEFFQGGLKVGESAAAPYQCAIAGLAGGLYVFTARAYDDSGAMTESAPINVTVKEPTQPLEVALTAPVADATFEAGENVTLAAEAVGGNGGIARVEFFAGDRSLGVVAAAPYTLAWSGVAVGDYTLTATATDTSGQTAVSDAVSVRIRRGLPFAASFETSEGYAAGSLDGQQNWSASPGVLVSGEAAWSGASGVWLPPATQPGRIDHDFAPPLPGQSIVFVDFCARPVAGTNPATSVLCEVGGARVAFVGSGGQGEFYVFRGDGAGGGQWQPAEYQYLVSTSASGVAQWFPEIGFRFDFVRKTWDLLVDGLMLAADVGMTDASATYASRFTLYGNSTQPVAMDLFSIGFDNLAFTDADRDGMDDQWEISQGLDPTVNDRNDDPDHDGLTNVHEFVAGTETHNADTDGDGLTDGFEVKYHFDPLQFTFPTDDDEDGLSQIEEAALGTDPNDYFNGETPVIVVVSGDNSPTGEFVVKVQRPDGTPYVNAPVSFDVQADTACMATNPDSTNTHQTMRLRTDGEGLARVFLRRPASPALQSP